MKVYWGPLKSLITGAALITISGLSAFAEDPILPPLNPLPTRPAPLPTRTPFAAQYCTGGLRANLERCLNTSREAAFDDPCCKILFLDTYSCGGGEKNFRFVGESKGKALSVKVPCYDSKETNVCTQAALPHCEDITLRAGTKPGLKTLARNSLDLHFLGKKDNAVTEGEFGPLPDLTTTGKIDLYYKGKDSRLMTADSELGGPIDECGTAGCTDFPKKACNLVGKESAGSKYFGDGDSACGKGVNFQIGEGPDGFNLDIFNAETWRNKNTGFNERESSYKGGAWIEGIQCHLSEVKKELDEGNIKVSSMCLAVAYDVNELHTLQLDRVKKYLPPPICQVFKKREFDAWEKKQRGESTNTTSLACADDTSIADANGRVLSKGARLAGCYFESAQQMTSNGAFNQLLRCEVYARANRNMSCEFYTSEKILAAEIHKRDALMSCAHKRAGFGENIDVDIRRCESVGWDWKKAECFAARTGSCYREQRENYFRDKTKNAFGAYCAYDSATSTSVKKPQSPNEGSPNNPFRSKGGK